MRICALIALAGWLLLSRAVCAIVADELAPVQAPVFLPPAPSENPLPEPLTDLSSKNADPPPVVEPTPLTVPNINVAPIVVPPVVPHEIGGGRPEEIESPSNSSNITIRIGPDGTRSGPKPADFSTSRWWPGAGTMEWMPGHRDRFGMFSLTGGAAVAWDNWGGISSGFGYGFHFLNGPVQTDLPSRLYDLNWGLNWIGEIMPGWSASLAGKAGIYSDFEDSARDGWRFPAHAVVFHDWTGTVSGALGVKYFARDNLPPLPVVGLVLRPDDRVRIEALFPEPRIAWQVAADEESEHWLSLAGQIGGGQWAIERANTDRADVVTYNDYRAVLGFHNYKPGELDQAFEAGYIFARDLTYRSGVGNFHPGDTFFFRFVSRY